MSKSRLVNTIFWEDNYTANLDPIEKLLFLYALTNSSANIAGIYQITVKKIAVETGIDKEMVEKIFGRFERDDRMYYRDGWLGIKNFIKHQNQNSPKIKKGIENELINVPESMKELLLEKGIDTLSHLIKLNTIKYNVIQGAENPAQEAKKAKKTPVFSQLGAEVLKAFEEIDPKNKTYYANTTQRKAADFLVSEHGLEKVLYVIGLLKETNNVAYFPSITSPNDLKEKWAKLSSAIVRKKQESAPINRGRGIAE